MKTTCNNGRNSPRSLRRRDPRRVLLAIRRAWREQVDLQEKMLDVTRY
jgi:hypothetical protein